MRRKFVLTVPPELFGLNLERCAPLFQQFARLWRRFAEPGPGLRVVRTGNMEKEGLMTKDHGPSIKDDETYQALRDDGASKEKAARIANAQANDNMSPSKKGGSSSRYEDWTKDDLYDRAQELDISGRSDMTKGELIDALRNH